MLAKQLQRREFRCLIRQLIRRIIYRITNIHWEQLILERQIHLLTSSCDLIRILEWEY